MSRNLAPIDLQQPGAAAPALAAALRERSYACVQLPETSSRAVDRLLTSAPVFFSSSNKPDCSKVDYQGFHVDAEQQKEVLFVRLDSQGLLHPSPGVPQTHDEIAQMAAEAYQELHACCAECLSMVAEEFGVADDLTSLLDSVRGQPQQRVSSSYMTLFQYNAKPPASGHAHELKHGCAESASLPCPEHVDYSLLTLAPFTEPGLEVLDLKSFEWVCPEKDMQRHQQNGGSGRLATIMVGESLEFLSSNMLTATVHRVVPCFDKARISCPMLLHPRDEALLDPACFPAQKGPGHSKLQTPLFAGQFIANSQRLKKSAIYGR